MNRPITTFAAAVATGRSARSRMTQLSRDPRERVS